MIPTSHWLSILKETILNPENDPSVIDAELRRIVEEIRINAMQEALLIVEKSIVSTFPIQP